MHHSQALLQHGGKPWRHYNDRFAPQLLEAQRPDGSFARPGGGGRIEAVNSLFAQDDKDGLHYRNSLCILMLEVYYRYLPGIRK